MTHREHTYCTASTQPHITHLSETKLYDDIVRYSVCVCVWEFLTATAWIPLVGGVNLSPVGRPIMPLSLSLCVCVCVMSVSALHCICEKDKNNTTLSSLIRTELRDFERPYKESVMWLLHFSSVWSMTVSAKLFCISQCSTNTHLLHKQTCRCFWGGNRRSYAPLWNG